MKAKTIIYIIIGLVVLYLIYKAYINYKASGSVFKSSNIVYDPLYMPGPIDDIKPPTSFTKPSCFSGGIAPPPPLKYYIENGKFYVTGGLSGIINEGTPEEISSTAYVVAYIESRRPCGSNNASGGVNYL